MPAAAGGVPYPAAAWLLSAMSYSGPAATFPKPSATFSSSSPAPFSRNNSARGCKPSRLNLPGRWEAETGRPFLAAALPATLPPLPAFCFTYAGSRGQRCPELGCTAPGRGEATEQIFRSETLLRRCVWSRALAASRTPSCPEIQAPALPSPCLERLQGELPPRDPRNPWPEPSAGRGVAPLLRPELRLPAPTCDQKNTTSPLSLPYNFFFFTLLLLFFPPPVTVCGK